MKNIVLFVVVFSGFMIWQSCQYDWMEPVEPSVPDVVSFSAHIIPIFNKSCNSTGCHATGGIPPDLTPANAFDALFARNLIDLSNAANSKLYTKCAPGGSMYKYTKPNDPEVILKWIQQGAKNN